MKIEIEVGEFMCPICRVLDTMDVSDDDRLRAHEVLEDFGRIAYAAGGSATLRNVSNAMVDSG